MVGNNGMKNIFGRIESKKLVGFNSEFGQKEKIIGSNNLENNGRNN